VGREPVGGEPGTKPGTGKREKEGKRQERKAEGCDGVGVLYLRRCVVMRDGIGGYNII
jgi:hypothetical protein